VWIEGCDRGGVGVDTHLDFHGAVVLDPLGRRLGEAKIPTTLRGYRNLLLWAEEFGPVRCTGVEGTGSYGAGLARHLKAAGIALWRSRDPNAATSGATANPIPKTQRSQLGRCSRARQRVCPRAQRVAWR
jgi:hypothetical protein